MPDSMIDISASGRDLARLGEGLWMTLKISLSSASLSVLAGVPVGLLMTSKRRFWRTSLRPYLEAMRITPFLALLLLFCHRLSAAFSINLPTAFVPVLVFTLWGTAGMADLVRGAVTSLPKHHRESGRALGLGGTRPNLRAIVPQAVRRLLPGVINLTSRMIKTAPSSFRRHPGSGQGGPADHRGGRHARQSWPASGCAASFF